MWTSQSANLAGREGDTPAEAQPGPLRDGDAGRDRKGGRGGTMAPHSSTFVWKIPWTEETGALQSMGSLGVRHD